MSGDLPLVDSGSIRPEAQAAETSWFRWSDSAGMVASIGCAIHCAAMPFVIAYLPALGLSFLADEAFHKWMAVGCFAIALTAFIPGFRKHGRLTPVVVGSVGLVLISVAAFGLAGECCAACSNTAATAVAAEPDSSRADFAAVLVSAADQEVCTEACCPHCANASPDASSEAGGEVGGDLLAVGESAGESAGESSAGSAATSSVSNGLISRIAPWMTPVGGIVLVCAHLLNRRYGCLCGCCEGESSAIDA